MNRKWLMLAAGAAAAALGYGATKVYGNKKKSRTEALETEQKTAALNDSGIETITCSSCYRPVRDYELICPYCGQDMRKREIEEPVAE